jgi:alpha-1,3-rhamnosyl/mannosyltransferase
VAAEHDDAGARRHAGSVRHGISRLLAVRIAIDARAAAEVPAGRGRYVRELLGALAREEHDHEYVLLGRRAWDHTPRDRRFRWTLRDLRDPIWALWAAGAVRACDGVLATNSYLLCAARPPSVATVYDLVAFERELGAPAGSAAERLTLPLAVRRAHALACISQATRDALVERFPKSASRAHVVTLGVEDRFFVGPDEARVAAGRLGLERPYVLMTGTLEPRKNVARAVEAFAGLPAALRERYELVLAGPRGWATEAIDAALSAHRDVVRVLGHVPEADLPGVYAGAELFVYPSLREGFGLPVLEAMAAGTAVVTSSISSLPEVGGAAARYADPYDVGAIREGIEALLADDADRARLAALGRERARSFDWARTARATLALLPAVSGAA